MHFLVVNDLATNKRYVFCGDTESDMYLDSGSFLPEIDSLFEEAGTGDEFCEYARAAWKKLLLIPVGSRGFTVEYYRSDALFSMSNPIIGAR